MANYKRIIFFTGDTAQQEMLIAMLNEEGFEGFEQDQSELKAFIVSSRFDPAIVDQLANENHLAYVIEDVEDINWNALWESNFEPVIIDKRVAIRADFHSPVDTLHEIIITPKMSFGTGHHATTSMMITQMLGIDFNDKKVLDFGTGTGILAILAEQLGAESVVAIDHDVLSIDNAKENLQRNETEFVEIFLAEDAGSGNHYDVILANINRNVLLDNMQRMAEQLNIGGVLIVSGILGHDEKDIMSSASKFDLRFIYKLEQNNWISLSFKY